MESRRNSFPFCIRGITLNILNITREKLSNGESTSTIKNSLVEKTWYNWKTLLPARAIENQAYVIGVNRIGNDGNTISYSGDSAVLNFKGEELSHTKLNEESVETVSFDYKALEEFRKIFPVGLDAGHFSIEG